VLADKAIEPAAFPAGVLATPAVVDVVGALAVVERVEVERVQMVSLESARIAPLGEDVQPAAVG
jgi:hypothetical protein